MTAYGYWQFLEIDKIEIKNEKFFDKDLLDRLNKFLVKTKNGKGGFDITRGLDRLGNPEQEVSDFFSCYCFDSDIS